MSGLGPFDHFVLGLIMGGGATFVYGCLSRAYGWGEE